MVVLIILFVRYASDLCSPICGELGLSPVWLGEWPPRYTYKGSNARSPIKNTLTNRLWQFENDRLKVNELFCIEWQCVDNNWYFSWGRGGDILFSLSLRTSGTSLHQGDSQGSSNKIIASNSTSLFSLWVSRSPEGNPTWFPPLTRLHLLFPQASLQSQS